MQLLFDSDDSETDSESKSEQKRAFEERHKLDPDKQNEQNAQIRKVIKQLRHDAKVHLGIADYKTLPLTRIYSKLQNSGDYQKKRELKLLIKDSQQKGDLKNELQGIEDQLKMVTAPQSGQVQAHQLKEALTEKIAKLKQVLGLEKRIKHASIEGTSVTQLDAMPLNANSFQL